MPTVNDIQVITPDEKQKQQCGQWPIWTCEKSTFDWDYTQKEICLLLEGRVKVTDRPAGSDSVTFGPGDMVTFPQGLKCIWEVQEPVKKHYTFE